MSVLDHLRKKSRQFRETPFEQGWQWRLDIDGGLDDFDMYAKDISYGATEISVEAKRVGTIQFQDPVSAEPVTLAVTCRDHVDGRVGKWFDSCASKVVNNDGTINLPKDFLFAIRVMALQEDGTETEREKWTVVPLTRGDTSKSVASSEGFVEIPLTFIQYRSIGG